MSRDRKLRVPDATGRLFSALALATWNALAQDSSPATPIGRSDYLVVAGGYGLFHDESNANGALAYNFHEQWLGIHPELLAGFASHSSYVTARLTYAFRLSPRFSLGLGTGPGLYGHQEKAPNLGSPVEFLSTLALTHRTVGEQRIGLTFGHISNAHLAPYNPGSNLIELLYEMPVR